MPLGYVPYLRPGALIFTAIVWRHLLRGRTNETSAVEDVYGHIGGRKRNLLGERVLHASKSLFGQSLSAEQVLLRHTLFGVYSRALPQSSADSWAKAIVGVGRRSYPPSQIQMSVAAKGFRFFTADLRSCKTCITRDMDEFGFPSWYLLHVLPPVHHCPYHGDALNPEIKGSVGGNMWKLRLPTGVPLEISSQRFEAASDGYVGYLRCWVDLLEGRLPMIAADAWANCVDLVIERMGSVEDAVCELSRQLTRSWNSPADRLPDILGAHVQRDFVRNELEHRAAPGRIAQKLVMLMACDSMGILQAKEGVPEQLNMPLLPIGQANQFRSREKLLRGAVLHTGFPLAIVVGLASGHSVLAIGRSAGVHRHQVTRAIASLPTAILEALRADESWEADSWLTKELLRRDGMKAS